MMPAVVASAAMMMTSTVMMTVTMVMVMMTVTMVMVMMILSAHTVPAIKVRRSKWEHSYCQ
jgi:hypothetical protein